MFYVFLLLALILPLIVCLVWRWYSGQSKEEFSGKLFGHIQIKSVGAFVVYLIVLILNILFFYPGAIGVENIGVHTRWEYHLKIYRANVAKNKFNVRQLSDVESILDKRGVVDISRGGGDVLHVANEDIYKNDAVMLGSYGLADKKNVYIPLVLNRIKYMAKDHNKVITYGTYSQSNMLLHLYTLQEKELTKSHLIYGRLRLERIWPLWPMIVNTMFPLMIVLLLSFMGNITGNIVANLSLPSFHGIVSWINNVEIKLTGMTVCYFIVYLFVAYLIKGDILVNSIANNFNAYKVCKMIQGVWHHHLYYKMNTQPYKLKNVGRLQVKCDINMKNMQLKGFNNPINIKYGNLVSCYKRKNLKGRSWHVELAGIIDNKLIGVYEVDNRKIDMGVLNARIDKDFKYQTIHFSDFHKPLQDLSENNSGQMGFFKSDSDRQIACDALYSLLENSKDEDKQ